MSNSELTLNVNGQSQTVSVVDPEMPLLWVLRDHLNLAGAKYGCGIGQCGACTVHIDGKPALSCLVPASQASNVDITTIEGLAQEDGTLHPVQQAWLEIDVAQCGYCQTGQIMRAAALLSENAAPTDDQIDQALDANICRCGTYSRIRDAVRHAAGDRS